MHIALIKLPVKTLKEDSSLIGTMLIAQIHAAIFSFGDLPLERRPGFSLFVDEFQHFATTDFAEMFTEGRKFGSRVCIAHQFREQIPDTLAAATVTARTIVTFQTAPQDGPKMAPLYIQQSSTELQKEDIYPDVVKHLLTYGHTNTTVADFIKDYLRPVNAEGSKIQVMSYRPTFWEDQFAGYTAKKDAPRVTNPLTFLNALLYEAEVKQDWQLPIPEEVILGFSNSGRGYFNVLKGISKSKMAILASPEVVSSEQTREEAMGKFPGKNNEKAQLMHFLLVLRIVMQVLVEEPLGEKKPLSAGDVAQRIVHLPRRQALVRVGNDITQMRTLDTPSSVSINELTRRKQLIIRQTRAKYCKQRSVVEQEIEQRQQGGIPVSQQTQRIFTQQPPPSATSQASQVGTICPACGNQEKNKDAAFCSTCGTRLSVQPVQRARFSEIEDE